MKPIIDKLTKQQEKARKEFDKLNGMLSYFSFYRKINYIENEINYSILNY